MYVGIYVCKGVWVYRSVSEHLGVCYMRMRVYMWVLNIAHEWMCICVYEHYQWRCMCVWGLIPHVGYTKHFTEGMKYVLGFLLLWKDTMTAAVFMKKTFNCSVLLTVQRFSPLSTCGTWQCAHRHGAGEGAESPTSCRQQEVNCLTGHSLSI